MQNNPISTTFVIKNNKVVFFKGKSKELAKVLKSINNTKSKKNVF